MRRHRCLCGGLAGTGRGWDVKRPVFLVGAFYRGQGSELGVLMRGIKELYPDRRCQRPSSHPAWAAVKQAGIIGATGDRGARDGALLDVYCAWAAPQWGCPRWGMQVRRPETLRWRSIWGRHTACSGEALQVPTTRQHCSWDGHRAWWGRLAFPPPIFPVTPCPQAWVPRTGGKASPGSACSSARLSLP